jgi:hypothetical protein
MFPAAWLADLRNHGPFGSKIFFYPERAVVHG